MRTWDRPVACRQTVAADDPAVILDDASSALQASGWDTHWGQEAQASGFHSGDKQLQERASTSAFEDSP